MLEALFAGAIAGYAIAIPVGAIAALLITLGAQHGARLAAGGAFGAASVDAVYAIVAVAAGAVIAPLIAQVEEPLRWISVAVLTLVNPVTVIYFAALVGGVLVIALAVRAAFAP